MKKLHVLLSSSVIAASLMAGIALPSVNAESSKTASPASTNSIITPLAVIGSGSASFPGQGQANFTFKGTSSTEGVRVYILNTGSKAFTVRLISPKGYVWIDSTTINAGNSATFNLNLNQDQNGSWAIDTYSNDGSTYSFTYNVRDGVVN